MEESDLGHSGDDIRLASSELAALIIDALVSHCIIERDQFEAALKVAVQEIDIRKLIGDY